ncbi:zinc uptake transcriptional repressor Zur [Blochmannia endosymbiont of Camponotus (Colobopsis) obliquus]|uniref:zinc uptake transcriptional repressor Zur n=1 Tax=Blochmannia endosymbiont of Camponotus (Colobopsis) obliquus TaxID=1505597 RepID=UPI00061A6C99|nr:zinc uptake transcriptional repressor Zur [Blochmannia endosymbiont of Camponotus (Colobopsis) obliquus]AKC60210.1 Zinc uptake regulation protein [Blochmannia endosymbiont of Camponotus (Colobopsis) obliquus]
MKTKLQQLLYRIKTLCNQRCVRLTPQRLEVLRIICQQTKAISAYDLLDLLKKSIPKAKPPTIYRALNFLLLQGFIHRVESTNKFMICNYFSEPSHAFAFLICDNCNKVIEQTTQNIKEILQQTANVSGFKISYNIIEAHGICKQCDIINIS